MSPSDPSDDRTADPGADPINDPDDEAAPEPEDDENRTYDVGRTLAFSDGVFAIAITLLVLSLQLPDGTTDANLGDALRDLRPELFAYALTVLVIGAFWIGHHRLFDRIERVDSALMRFNVIYLGLIALLPFPTDVLGRYGGTRPAVVVYAAAVGLASLADAGLEFYARRNGLLLDASGEPAAGRVAPPITGLVFLATVPIALWNAPLAQWCWLAAIPAGMWEGRQHRRQFGGGATRQRRN